MCGSSMPICHNFAGCIGAGRCIFRIMAPHRACGRLSEMLAGEVIFHA